MIEAKHTPLFSIIIPVYNRPQEVQELLESLTHQTSHDFEVVIVEDGSQLDLRCDKVVNSYANRLDISYYEKENGGPAAARNFGAVKAQGKWLVFFDSDCLIPEQYITNATKELQDHDCQLFGGADRSHPSFTPLQKAIDYSMTSILTTGGIRGNKKSADKFYPRTFNMGIRKEVFDQIGGFSNMRFGEDVDFSYKVKEGGYDSRLFHENWVYHKRRNTFRTFFKQVFNSGIARIHLTRRHPGTLKIVHLLPSAFVLGSLFLIAVALTVCPWAITPLLLLAMILWADATFRTKSLCTGALAVAASFTQLTGYGSGLIAGWWNICIRGRHDWAAFTKNFYR
jgi:glycosyltransferase involved in cell wall biosynthesis